MVILTLAGDLQTKGEEEITEEAMVSPSSSRCCVKTLISCLSQLHNTRKFIYKNCVEPLTDLGHPESP